MVLSDREVVHRAWACLGVAVGVKLRVMVGEDLRGRVEVVVVHESDLRVIQVADECLKSALLDPW